MSGRSVYTSAMYNTPLRFLCRFLFSTVGAGRLRQLQRSYRYRRRVYTLSATAVSYTMAMPALTAAAKEKATSWCASLDKGMQLRQQVRGWRPMQVELNFRCLAPDEASAATVAFK